MVNLKKVFSNTTKSTGILLCILLALQCISCSFPFFELIHGHLIPFLFTFFLVIHVRSALQQRKGEYSFLLTGFLLSAIYYIYWLSGLNEYGIFFVHTSIQTTVIIFAALLLLHVLYKPSKHMKWLQLFVYSIVFGFFIYSFIVRSKLYLHISEVLVAAAVGSMFKNDRFVISLALFTVFIMLYNFMTYPFLATDFSKILISFVYTLNIICALKRVFMES